MRILYGIQGTGNGHLARARALVPELLAQGHELDFVFSGRQREDFFDMQLFGTGFKVFEGLSLITTAGQLDIFNTVKSNNLLCLLKNIRQLDLEPYDLVISDFEPVTAWAAKLRGKTSMSISHQSAFLYDIPKVKGHRLSKLLTRFFAPTTYSLGLHWHHFDQSILPPLIEPFMAKPVIKNKYLVYMGFENIDEILAFLMPFNHVKFEVFAKVDKKNIYGHITVNPLSHAEFHHHLCNCEGVISNSGFELASECLHLGKKILVKPLMGQFEQLSNALALQKIGQGSVMMSLDQAVLSDWLKLPARQPNYYPNVAKAVACWLNEGDWSAIEALSLKLWSEFDQPYQTDMNFGHALQVSR